MGLDQTVCGQTIDVNGQTRAGADSHWPIESPGPRAAPGVKWPDLGMAFLDWMGLVHWKLGLFVGIDLMLASFGGGAIQTLLPSQRSCPTSSNMTWNSDMAGIKATFEH